MIRAPALAGGPAAVLDGVEIALGPAVLAVERGLLFPAQPIAGRTAEAVFVGRARFRLDPPDEIEAGQLELFTGERLLDVPLDAAVLVLADPAPLRAILDGAAPHVPPPEIAERAAEVLGQWLDSPERRTAGVETALFKLLAGDAAFEPYFALWARSPDLGDFVYQLDPEEQEPITLASFRPLELTQWERLRLKHHLRVEQRKGRWLDMRVEELGAWDVWLSTAWAPERGPAAGRVGFESRHYAIDVRLERGSLALDGRARLELVAFAAGRRVVRLELLRDLVVSQVRDDAGRELFFFRSGDEIAVLLPEPSRAGQPLVLDIAYSGQALAWVAGKTYDLRDTSLWYPHCGTVDRATYDVTLRWPRKYDLVAGGRLVASGRDGPWLWERRRLDRPSIAFSFVVGEFLTEQVRSGDTEIRLALGLDARARLTPRLRERMRETVVSALQFFESSFGELPVDELTVVTVPRRFSQSYLGFVALADSLLEFPDPLGEAASWMRDTTVAHELAHQWWGNAVGWRSYRDQWLSEAMANYAALLFDSARAAGDDRLAQMSAGWRQSLAHTTVEGRSVESLGPVVLGARLSSSRARNGYRAIVYRKGAVVLAMLARAVGEERFLQTLRSLAESSRDGVLTTETFLDAMEREGGVDLDGFARQFVYGTGIPEVHYAYDREQDSAGGWTVRGNARLLFAPQWRYQIVRLPEGGWDVLRRAWPPATAGEPLLIVPYRVTLEADPADETGAAANGEPLRLRQSGQVVLRGHEDAFAIETAHRPLRLRLDPRGEILARFFSAESHPKRYLHSQAEDLAAAGLGSAAETRFLEALGQPTAVEGPRDPLAAPSTDEPAEGLAQDVETRLALARLYLDQGRLDEARELLDAIDREMDSERMPFRMQRDALQSRLEIVRGEYASAHRRLKKTLRLASPRQVRVPWRNLMLQLQLNTERAAVTEAYALLAVAAREVGDRDALDWARREAAGRGVDVSALE